MSKSIFTSKIKVFCITILQLGMVFVIPSISNPNSAKASQQDLQAMLRALGERETKDQPGDRYKVVNSLGFLGQYQVGEALLIDLGYYTPRNCTWYTHGASKNEWKGRWQIRNIRGANDFLNSPRIQDQVIRDAFALNWHYVNSSLGNINGYLGHEPQFKDYQGRLRKVRITTSGILAGAHLVGVQNTANFLKSGQLSKDERGTPIYDYMSEFNGYNITPADFGGRRPPRPSGC